MKCCGTEGMVKDFDYNASKNIDFCESCIGGKQHITPFDSSDTPLTYLSLSTQIPVEKSVLLYGHAHLLINRSHHLELLVRVYYH